MRILSTVPSLTELLWYLGADEQVVGITKFCVHPRDWHRSKPRIGGTKTLHIERIRALQPDLIIANKEENTKSDIETLQADFDVLLTDINNWQEALEAIQTIGNRIGAAEKAAELIQLLQQKKADWLQARPQPPLRAAYLIWRDPYMVAASQTYIHEMLGIAGYENVFADQTRYPIIEARDLENAHPDEILLSSEPYPFDEKHLAELQAICPQARVRLVDGEAFSWYGSRMLEALEYFRTIMGA